MRAEGYEVVRTPGPRGGEWVDEKWEVDGKALVEKLRGLSDTQALALIDAAERFWNERGDGQETETTAIKKYFYVPEQ